MRMVMAIFGDQNFLSLLCYLDDLVLAPNELLALQRLEMVFKKLKAHNLKLALKKCHCKVTVICKVPGAHSEQRLGEG